MKTFLKVICAILWIIICFISINLIIWIIRYKWVWNYAQILNSKDWQSSASKISILRPKTRFSIYYKDKENAPIETIDIQPENIQPEDVQVEDNIENTKPATSTNNNPYDPDYEDEFNSFFGTTNPKIEWETVVEEDSDDLWDIWFKTYETSDN